MIRELKIIKEDVTIHYREIRLGKTQKLVLVYIGVNTKEQSYIKRRTLTDGISDLLNYKDKESKKIYDKVSRSVRTLSKKGLTAKKGSYVGLTADGKDVARNVIEHIKSEYDGKIDWDIIAKYYYRKEKDSYRYAKGFVEIINKPYNTALLADVKEAFKKCKEGDIVSLQVLRKGVDKKKMEVETENKEDKKKTIKEQVKKIKSGKTKWKVFADNLKPELATEDNFEVYSDLLKMFPKVRPKVDERVQELFKHYDKVRERYPNYPPLLEEEWNEHPEYSEEWKKLDSECNKLMKVQKNMEAFSDYLFEISHDKYPDVAEKVIRFAIDKYQNDVKNEKNYIYTKK